MDSPAWRRRGPRLPTPLRAGSGLLGQPTPAIHKPHRCWPAPISRAQPDLSTAPRPPAPRPCGAALLRQAAQAGDTDAGLRLAALLISEKGAAALPECEQILRVAADRGDRRAQSALGRYLTRSTAAGLGAGFDEALVWLRRAAGQGDASAMATLGDIHLYLAKSPPVLNPAEGVAWYQRCATAGLPTCHYGLGRSYHLALGAARDLPRAWAHMSLARDHGVPRAAEEFGQIDHQLSPAQRADGVPRLADNNNPAG